LTEIPIIPIVMAIRNTGIQIIVSFSLNFPVIISMNAKTERIIPMPIAPASTEANAV